MKRKLALILILFVAISLSADPFDSIRKKAKKVGKKVGKTVKKGAKEVNKVANKGAKEVEKGAKTVKKKVEHKLGWDRYILCWGDTFVPEEERWVAIRPALKKDKHDIGRFWDIAGNGKECEGPNKPIMLWGITFQEYPPADRRYRFVSVYERTKHPDDFGYYWVQCKTGMWVQAQDHGQQIILNSGYDINNRNDPQANSYQWRIQNVGKNRFVFVSKMNNLVIDARGGNNTNGTAVQMWEQNNTLAQQWEMIYIATGDEVKSTRDMAEKRAMEVHKMTQQVTDQLGVIAKKVGNFVMGKVNSGLNTLANNMISLEKVGNKYTFTIGFPNEESLYDQLKAKTIDRLFKVDFKKMKFEPTDGKQLVVGIINRIECLGHHVDLTLEMICDWEISRNGLTLKKFSIKRFSLPFLPDRLTKGIRSSISGKMKSFNVNIKNLPGVDKISSPSNAPLKVNRIKKGPYGFEAIMTVN